MEVEVEVIISFVGSAVLGEVNQAADGLSARRDRVDKPVVTPGIVARHRIARDLHVGAFRFPVWSHVDPVLGPVTVEEVDDQRALECLSRGHLQHVVKSTAAIAYLRAFVFHMRDHVLDREGRIGSGSAAGRDRNGIGKTNADRAYGRIQDVELPITKGLVIVAVAGEKAGDSVHAVIVGATIQPIALDIGNVVG